LSQVLTSEHFSQLHVAAVNRTLITHSTNDPRNSSHFLQTHGGPTHFEADGMTFAQWLTTRMEVLP
jgi:hypothetical protein